MSTDIGIINTYPIREKLESMPQTARESFIERIVESQRPELCLLPQINGNHVSGLLSGQYEGYSPTHDGNTVLLYDVNRVHVKRLDISEYSNGHLGSLNYNDIVCTNVEIWTRQPSRTKTLEFHHITWEKGTFEKRGQGRNRRNDTEDKTLFEKFLAFCQVLAMKTGVPVFISGESTLFLKDILVILKKVKLAMRSSFLKEEHETLEDFGFLPSMTKGSTREQRDLFEMKPVSVKGRNDSCRMSDFVLASKRLQMTDPTPIESSSIFGSVSNVFFNGVCPLAMGIMYAARPPKHSSG